MEQRHSKEKVTEVVRYHLAVRSHVFCWGSWFVAAAVAVFAPLLVAQTPSPFPPGPGREALFKVCSNCHGPESVLGHLKTHDEWGKTLDEMANNGAAGSDEEWSLILAYLDRYYSLIFINKAPAKDLALTLDLPESVAQAIVQARAEKGDIKTDADLKRVPGVDSAKIDARKDRLVF
jgi:competence protein ComEA